MPMQRRIRYRAATLHRRTEQIVDYRRIYIARFPIFLSRRPLVARCAAASGSDRAGRRRTIDPRRGA